MASYTSTRPTSPIVWGLIVNTAHDSANVVEFIDHSGDFIWPTISVSINLFPCSFTLVTVVTFMYLFLHALMHMLWAATHSRAPF